MQCPTCGAAFETASGCAACLLAGALEMTTASIGAAPERSADGLESDTFGPYEIVRVLGQGGMGTVYLANQLAPIQRRVAVKVVRPGMDTSRILARFAYERQSLARMEHPNIARVYDASATAKGRPFFVMEYIDGEPITTYCDRMRMSTAERLRLFLPVCQAVQHAHARGILHRDIKPSNILVAVVDGQPVPKMIDFGISKALDQGQLDVTAFTEFGQLVGTPEYMSPEAADTLTGDIDAASDVYSLGVTLYELLVGAVPFEGRFLRKAGVMELLRILREEEAPAMTKKLTLLGDSASEIAERRSTDTSTLKRQLTGDLNWIVMKAVEKGRDRRYGSPFELLSDIQMHLSDRPVLASPPGVMYRARKFVKRNRGAVLAGAAIAAVLLAGVAGTLVQAREALRQREIAEASAREAGASRLRAEAEASRALVQEKRAEENLEAMRSLAHSMLTELDAKVRPLMGGTEARETLVKLGTQYLDRMPPASASEAFMRMGELQASMWNHAEAAVHFRKAIGAQSARPIEVAEAWAALSEVEETWIDQNQAIMGAEKIAKGLPANEPRVLRVLSKAARYRSDDLRAYELSERAFALSAKTPSDRKARIEAGLAHVRALVNGNGGAAAAILAPLRADVEKLVAREPANADYRALLMACESMLGHVLGEATRLPESIQQLDKAIAIGRSLADADPKNGRWRVEEAELLRLKGYVLMQMDRREEGMKSFDAAIGMMKQRLAESPRTAEFALKASMVLANSAFFLNLDRKSALALARYKEAVEILDEPVRRYPARAELRAARAEMLLNYGAGFGNAGQREKWEELVMQALRETARLVAVARDGAFLSSHGSALNAHSVVLLQQGRSAEAIAKKREAAAAYRKALVLYPDNRGYRSGLVNVLSNLSRYYFDRLDLPNAIDTAKDTLRVAEYAWVRWPRELESAQMMLGVLFHLRYQHTNIGEHVAAIGYSRRAVAVARESYGHGREDKRRAESVAFALNNLAGDYQRVGERTLMIETARETARFLKAEVQHAGYMTYRRQAAANLLVDLARFLSKGEILDEAAALADEGIAELASLSTADPGNDPLARHEIAAREVRERIAIDSLDLATAVRQSGALLALREKRSLNAAGNRRLLGVQYLRHAAHLGGSAEHQAKGMALVRQGYDLAMAEIGKRQRDLAARREAMLAAQDLGVAMEWRGDVAEARDWYAKAVEQASKMRAQESKNDMIAWQCKRVEALAGAHGPFRESVYLQQLLILGIVAQASEKGLAQARRMAAEEPNAENRTVLAGLLLMHVNPIYLSGSGDWAQRLIPYVREAVAALPSGNLTPQQQELVQDVRVIAAGMEEYAAGRLARAVPR